MSAPASQPPPAPACVRCGAALPAGGPPGVCPQCELTGALGLLTNPAAEAPDAGAGEPLLADAAGAPLRHFGDYELLEEIARGGMGVVYRARQRSLDRVVAVKMLLSGPLASRDFVQRFRTEAATAASLQHPNIVAIHEVGFHAGHHFLAMDFVPGRTLAEAIGQQPMASKRAAIVLQTVAEAVHHAHEHGVLHRDLKPSNVILDAEDQPHLTDFGLAKRLTDQTEVTLSAQTLGSPNYLPPEQATTTRGKVSRRSDVYSLGAMLYHALTGRPPFVSATLAETLRALLDTEPVRPRLLNPALPADLETICLRCLEKDSSRRYATAREFAEELGRWLRGEPILARPARALEKARRWCQRKPALAAALGGILLLLVVVAVGSTIAALRLQRQGAALREALRSAHQSEAQLRRQSGQAGQRWHALEDLARAAAFRPSLELRNEAIAALVLPDLREVRRVGCALGHALAFDARMASFVEYAITNDESREAIVRRVEDGAEVARVSLAREAGGMTLSPNGRYLVVQTSRSADTSSMRVEEVRERLTAFETEAPARGWPVDFHADERHVALSRAPDTVLIADLTTRRTVAELVVGFPANRLRFRPGAPWIAVAGFGRREIAVFDWVAGSELVRVTAPGSVSSSLDWSPDGTRLAVGCVDATGSDVVQLWEWRDGQPQPTLTLRGHHAPVMLARFVPGTDLLLTSAYEPSTRLWSVTTGRQILFTPHELAMDSVAGVALGFLEATSSYAQHEIVTGAEYRLLDSPRTAPAQTSVAFSPTAPLVASACSDGVRLWHLPGGQPLGVLPVGASQSALFHPTDGSLLVAARDRVTRWPVALSPGGETLTVGPPEVVSEAGPRGVDFRLACSADGSRLAATAGDRVEVIAWGHPEPTCWLNEDAEVGRVALSPDGAWAVTTDAERFRIWRLPEGVSVRELPGGGFQGGAFSPDGRWLVCSFRPPGGGDGLHRLVRVGDWETVREFSAVNTVWNVSVFSPNSRMLALRNSSSGVHLVDVQDGSEVATFDVPEQQMISDLAFSPDGTRLGVACETGLVQVWDLREVRRSLAGLGLDWDLPPYAPAVPGSAFLPRLVAKP